MIPRVELNYVNLGKIILLAHLGLLLDKNVIEYFDEALHCFLEWQLIISSKELQIKVSLGDLFFLEHRALVLNYVQCFSFLLELREAIQILQFLISFQFLFSIQNVLRVELLQYLSGKLAPKLGEEVTGGQQQGILPALVGESLGRGESSTSNVVIEHNGYLSMSKKRKVRTISEIGLIGRLRYMPVPK